MAGTHRRMRRALWQNERPFPMQDHTVAEVKITYWGSIPCSVMVKEGRGNRVNVQLPKIYQVTIDAVATKQGATSAEDYAKGYRVEKTERDGEPQTLAQQIVDELIAQYPKEWLWQQRDQAGIDAAGQVLVENEANQA